MDLPVNQQWADVSFRVDSKSVMNYTGVLQLKIEEDRIILEPFGLELTVQALTPRGAVLESRGHLYFADCSLQDDIVELTVMQKGKQEEMRIRAEFSQHPDSLPVCQQAM
ncbi:MAG: hypothetical protein MK108_16100 [Mariniblastus sp.]|nr:hypothetical protein [Mariniblastus sp.]